MSDEFVVEWDVYRDDDGNPVTITPEQVKAIWRALGVVGIVRAHENSEPIGGWEGGWFGCMPDLGKSRLLGRMLVHGRPPTRTRPPEAAGAPGWWLLPGGDPFNGTAADRPPGISDRSSE